MENDDSWNEMIFRYIRAKKDWLSAHILKNRLEYRNDLAQKKVKADDATDLKVRKKIYLDKRVNTQKNPLFDEWCTGRMGKTSSGFGKPDEKFQTGWKTEMKNRSSNLPEKADDKYQSQGKNESSFPENSDGKYQTREREPYIGRREPYI